MPMMKPGMCFHEYLSAPLFSGGNIKPQGWQETPLLAYVETATTVTKVMHPDGRSMLFMHPDTQFMAYLEVNGPGWATFGHIGSDKGLLVDADEWAAFVALVNAVDDEVGRIHNEESN